MSKITTRIAIITPEEASKMLERNERNRPITQGNLELFEQKFRNGEMVLNGEAIKIAWDGRILDGQHRLTACVNTGIPFEVLIVEGLDDETQDTMDDGTRRSPAQQLSIEGVANCTNVAAMARATVLERRYSLRVAVSPSGKGKVATKPEILAEYRNNADHYQILMSAVRPIVSSTPLNSGSASLLVKLFDALDSEDAEEFWARVIDGQNLAKGNPIYELRRVYDAIVKKEARYRDSVTVAALTIKAWNAYRDGRSVGLLRFKPGGANPEQFPEAI